MVPRPFIAGPLQVDWLKRHLALPNGVPSRDCIRRLLLDRPRRKSSTAEPTTPSVPAMTGSATARGRASWSGLLQLSLVTIPVKAYPAASTSQQIHFNQLHAGCGQRIRYEKHCPSHGKVEAGAIVSGYAYAPDQYVIIDHAELEPLRPAKERALSLERFVDPHELDPALFSGRTLYLMPDGLAAQHAYAVLTQVLGQRRKWAVGRVVLGGHRVLALVRTRSGGSPLSLS